MNDVTNYRCQKNEEIMASHGETIKDHERRISGLEGDTRELKALFEGYINKIDTTLGIHLTVHTGQIASLHTAIRDLGARIDSGIEDSRDELNANRNNDIEAVKQIATLKAEMENIKKDADNRVKVAMVWISLGATIVSSIVSTFIPKLLALLGK